MGFLDNVLRLRPNERAAEPKASRAKRDKPAAAKPAPDAPASAGVERSRPNADSDARAGARTALLPRKAKPGRAAVYESTVTRVPVPREELEAKHPRLRGKLEPPTDGKPPKGVRVRTQDDGTRVVSINIHQAVPGGVDLDRRSQDIDALRDVAAYVNSVDPDVVAVQEVNDHRGKSGVASQASVLYHLLDADAMAFTPALGHEGYEADPEREYGTATYVRNGYSIEQAHDVDLPNDRGRVEDRSAGVVVVASPEGERTTVVNAHLTSGKDDAAVRRNQLMHLSGIVDSIRTDGSFEYSDAITEHVERASGLPEDVILLGDLNARRSSSSQIEEILDGAGLVHAADDPARGSDFDDEIDHVLRSDGLRATDYDVLEIPNDSLDDDAGTPTDHPMVVADITRRR